MLTALALTPTSKQSGETPQNLNSVVNSEPGSVSSSTKRQLPERPSRRATVQLRPTPVFDTDWPFHPGHRVSPSTAHASWCFAQPALVPRTRLLSPPHREAIRPADLRQSAPPSLAGDVRCGPEPAHRNPARGAPLCPLYGCGIPVRLEMPWL